jgi:hypothetical protein
VSDNTDNIIVLDADRWRSPAERMYWRCYETLFNTVWGLRSYGATDRQILEGLCLVCLGMSAPDAHEFHNRVHDVMEMVGDVNARIEREASPSERKPARPRIARQPTGSRGPRGRRAEPDEGPEAA